MERLRTQRSSAETRLDAEAPAAPQWSDLPHAGAAHVAPPLQRAAPAATPPSRAQLAATLTRAYRYTLCGALVASVACATAMPYWRHLMTDPASQLWTPLDFATCYSVLVLLIAQLHREKAARVSLWRMLHFGVVCALQGAAFSPLGVLLAAWVPRVRTTFAQVHATMVFVLATLAFAPPEAVPRARARYAVGVSVLWYALLALAHSLLGAAGVVPLASSAELLFYAVYGAVLAVVLFFFVHGAKRSSAPDALTLSRGFWYAMPVTVYKGMRAWRSILPKTTRALLRCVDPRRSAAD